MMGSLGACVCAKDVKHNDRPVKSALQTIRIEKYYRNNPGRQNEILITGNEKLAYLHYSAFARS